MMQLKTAAAAAIVTVCLAFGGHAMAAAKESDAQVRARIIRQSIASYPGSCPCPYNVDRGGRSCGRRSAYNRRGGYAPKCYPADVSAAEVAAARR